MVLDANIVIYAANKPPEWLFELVLRTGNKVPSVVQIEVYGFPAIQCSEQDSLDDLFRHWSVIPLNETVISKAIEVRKLRRMGIADAIIAATALVLDEPLVTRNVDDFKHIPNLKLVNPFATQP